MNSISGRFLKFLLNIFRFKKLPLDKSGEEKPQPPKILYRKLKVDEANIDGRSIFYLSPKKSSNKTYILYLHGGAYLHSFRVLHWLFFEKVINKTGCVVVAPDYPLAPEYNYRDSFDFVLPLYERLALKVGGSNIVLMGDSAGGGFALALAQKIKEKNIDSPKQVILLSPWLDVSMKNEEIKELDSKDPLINVEKLKEVAKLYSGGGSLDDYMISPINGSIESIGNISIFIGTNDILLADSRKLKLKAEENRININYFEYEGMIHNWMLLGLPESKKAVSQIVELINNN